MLALGWKTFAVAGLEAFAGLVASYSKGYRSRAQEGDRCREEQNGQHRAVSNPSWTPIGIAGGRSFSVVVAQRYRSC
jgi:hypothetical protein